MLCSPGTHGAVEAKWPTTEHQSTKMAKTRYASRYPPPPPPYLEQQAEVAAIGNARELRVEIQKDREEKIVMSQELAGAPIAARNVERGNTETVEAGGKATPSNSEPVTPQLHGKVY